MHLIIIGAGPVGNRLIELAQKARWDVVMIEPNSERAEACADRHDVRVLTTGIADGNLANEANFDQAHAIIATTTDDSTNLMAMFLAREHGIEVLTSTVNQAAHRPMFEHLNVHILADPEILVAQHLLDITLLPHATDVTTLQDKEQIIELDLNGDSPLSGRTLGEIARDQVLPDGLFIVSVERDEEAFFPVERTRLASGDRLIIFSRHTISHDDLAVFTSNKD